MSWATIFRDRRKTPHFASSFFLCTLIFFYLFLFLLCKHLQCFDKNGVSARSLFLVSIKPAEFIGQTTKKVKRRGKKIDTIIILVCHRMSQRDRWIKKRKLNLKIFAEETRDFGSDLTKSFSRQWTCFLYVLGVCYIIHIIHGFCSGESNAVIFFTNSVKLVYVELSSDWWSIPR